MKGLVTRGRSANLREAAQALALDAATGTVVNGLRPHGIDCLLLRGLAIARRLYRGVALLCRRRHIGRISARRRHQTA
jgi:hypothetical protein